MFVPFVPAGSTKIIKVVDKFSGLPGKSYFTGANAASDAFSHLQKYHGLDPNVASNRLHKIKQRAGLGGADNVTIGSTGDVFDARTNEYLGSLTDGSLGK